MRGLEILSVNEGDMSPNAEIYDENRARQRVARLVVELPQEECEAVDGWGAQAGFPSRSAAVRHLLKRGMATERQPQAAE